MITKDVMKSKISLHGLGFVQIQLGADQRIHVWHPELPRRTCFEHSAIHDHRFDFTSLVLVGTQRNIQYVEVEGVAATEHPKYDRYKHERARQEGGGRPWDHDGTFHLRVAATEDVEVGGYYQQTAYIFHKTEPVGGKVATLMRKTWEGQFGATSTCLVGHTPDTNFDRFQWTDAQLWEVVVDVLGSR